MNRFRNLLHRAAPRLAAAAAVYDLGPLLRLRSTR
jgi:hypothetical protein